CFFVTDVWRMPCIMATLKTPPRCRGLTQQVDNFSLAFISPLGAQHDYVLAHCVSSLVSAPRMCASMVRPAGRAHDRPACRRHTIQASAIMPIPPGLSESPLFGCMSARQWLCSPAGIAQDQAAITTMRFRQGFLPRQCLHDTLAAITQLGNGRIQALARRGRPDAITGRLALYQRCQQLEIH